MQAKFNHLPDVPVFVGDEDGEMKMRRKGDFSSVPLNMNTITIHHQVTGWLVYRISRGCGGGGEFILR